ncbi:DUF1834 family protein [Myxococcota bacterium]|nr:DUF1834 family protein [Myxococcota bacterium]
MSLRITPTLTATAAAMCVAIRAETTGLGAPVEVAEHEGDPAWFIQSAAQRLPAVGVIYAGGEDDMQGPLGGVHHANWVVLVLVRSERRPANSARNTEAGIEVGAWELLARVRAALVLNDLALDGLTPLEPVTTELLGAEADKDRRLALYQLHFSATHEWREADGDDDLETVGATYETPNTSGTWSVQAEDELEQS